MVDWDDHMRVKMGTLAPEKIKTKIKTPSGRRVARRGTGRGEWLKTTR